MGIELLTVEQVNEYLEDRGDYFNGKASGFEKALPWFRGLGLAKLEELARLEFGVGSTGERFVDPEFVMDWIEDHGGEREWYYSYYLNPNKVKQYRQELARIGR